MFFVRSAEIVPCPCCQNRLRVIGSRKRTWIQGSGSKAKIIIRRLRCLDCRKIHHELPNFLVPYRRHEAQVIEDAVMDKAAPAGVEESTIRRWRQWFEVFAPYAAGCLESIAHRFQWTVESASALPQTALHRIGRIVGSERGWLERIVRPIANLHLWVHTRSAF
ncbi:DUF6431 domain-containing protein [Alicyclobacillus ferrooxydans]|uniref:DUF6431 domain-containing protein n=1 Tax=Alicyclobacillus ferrooxydans TaxID=471514 RepID=A0A0P9EXL6_9BACL|nr:DUF6431 domain-containing protein [Alicyclobacillus ferrooxydans]KPV43866.1 hypothetical protein AN477_10775 [Alicyclobacillus ferrooxydans]